MKSAAKAEADTQQTPDDPFLPPIEEPQDPTIKQAYTMIPQQYRRVIAPEPQHQCPTCAELDECHSTGDNYHSCKWCGSTWRDAR